MVNGNYILYGDRPSSETEVIDDHVHSRTAERKSRRKPNRTANELQRTLNMTHLDNETDADKNERNNVTEPKLHRYIPTTDVEQNYVTAKFETTEEPPRRYAFTKKPKNPTDGSVHYAYSRSSSSCSSPGGNLPTISEHGEQYGTYRVRAPASPVRDLVSYDRKLDRYFVKPREPQKFLSSTGYNGSHPDSLYRVPATAEGKDGRMAQTMRLLRWPMALIVTCVALALFVYFLMPDTIHEAESNVVNGTFWETGVAGARSQLPKILEHNKSVIPVTKSPEKLNSSEGTKKPSHGTKTTEIDFYDIASESNVDIQSLLDMIRDTKANRKLPLMPVYPSHIAPEVQYGNEKADEENTRTPKTISDNNLVPAADSTVKPHITQKPEKPLAIYFKENDAVQTNTETFASSQATNNFGRYDGNKNRNIIHKVLKPYKREETVGLTSEPEPEILQYRDPITGININFTSGHSKLFGISIEDAERFKSTTPSTVYNTKVSPTLPVWREGDDTTTKKYPNNSGLEGQPQCRSTQLALCRGVLPYDLAMMGTTKVGDLDVITLLPQIEYMVASNCSARFKQFACALLEPECSAPPNPPKTPCNSLCKSVLDSCHDYIPLELAGMFKCAQYPRSNCHSAHSPCNSQELMCGDGSCVPRGWICDGRRDCPNGEDEAKCVACTQNEFRCRTGDCIMQSWLCDGYEDCPDGEDERRCSSISVTTSPGSPNGGLSGTDASLLSGVGEELAGSAPALSVRRPNVVSPEGIKTTNSHRAVDHESSKELLMTSDSTNALKRNYTRRPSPSRLRPYPRTTRMPHYYTTTTTSTTENPALLVRTAMTSEQKNQILQNLKMKMQKDEFGRGDDEDIFAEMRRIANEQVGIIAVSSKQRIPTAPAEDRHVPLDSGASPIQQAVVGQNLTGNGLNQTVNKLNRLLNGQELMRKASKALEDATTPPDDDDVPPKGNRGEEETDWSAEARSSHSSPCPTGELRCVDGRCITLAQLCDGTIDCSDHADEDNCYT